MLRRLEISNFALIDRVVLEPGPGFIVLTGETGAGKSLLVDALAAVSGSRVTREVVRSGADAALVEAVFDAPPSGHAADEETEDDSLILSREIKASGGTVCRVNGRLVPLSRLRELAHDLLDIHGQMEQQRIFAVKEHRLILDRHGEHTIGDPRAAYQAVYSEINRQARRLRELGGSEAERARRQDMLRFQIEEIQTARLRPDEDIKLERSRDQLVHRSRLLENLDKAFVLLDGTELDNGAVGLSGQALVELRAASDWADELPELVRRLESVQIELQDVSAEIDQMRDRLDPQPELLERIDNRLDLIGRLKLKYGRSIPEIQAFLEEAVRQQEQLENEEQEARDLTNSLAGARRSLREKGEKLSRARQEAAVQLEAAIGSELADLGMPGARFKVALTAPVSGQAGPNGLEEVEFLFSANEGEAPRPLAAIASGGEASRIMLAIKSILAQSEPLQLLIFDEVDAGVSGRQASLTGRKLRGLAGISQVMCVTHTPQVAACADEHWLISKQVEDGHTHTILEKLDETGHVEAIASLLGGGKDPSASIELARSLIEGAGFHDTGA